MKPKRHIWEEGSTHRAVSGKEYDEVWDYVAALEAELADWHARRDEKWVEFEAEVEHRKQLEAQVAALEAELATAVQYGKESHQQILDLHAQVARLREAIDDTQA